MKAQKNNKKSKTDKITRVGSGRTKGSFSFYRVTLEDINKILKPGSTVVIARKFAETHGISGSLVGANFVEETVTV